MNKGNIKTSQENRKFRHLIDYQMLKEKRPKNTKISVGREVVEQIKKSFCFLIYSVT